MLQQPDFHTGRIPHFTLILFLLFINADETPHFLMPGLFCHSPQVSSKIPVQVSWTVNVVLSLGQQNLEEKYIRHFPLEQVLLIFSGNDVLWGESFDFPL